MRTIPVTNRLLAGRFRQRSNQSEDGCLRLRAHGPRRGRARVWKRSFARLTTVLIRARRGENVLERKDSSEASERERASICSGSWAISATNTTGGKFMVAGSPSASSTESAVSPTERMTRTVNRRIRPPALRRANPENSAAIISLYSDHRRVSTGSYLTRRSGGSASTPCD
jgi:hypothetical protein